LADAFNLQDTLAKYAKKPSDLAKPELILLYGPPGGGKTFTSATASEIPGVKKVLILDTEGSTSGSLLGFDDDIVQIVPVVRENSIESYKFLNTILERIFDPNTEGGYDVVIIDTFDVAQDWAADYFFDTAKTGKTGEKDGFEVWRNVKTWSIETARSLKRIDALGVLVVHDREEKEKSGAITTKLNLVGSARDVLPGIPDIVGYIYRELEEDGSEETYGEFASQGGKVTKNRFRFPPLVKDPNIAKLFKYITDKQKEASK
jgi:hypothetical protein